LKKIFFDKLNNLFFFFLLLGWLVGWSLLTTQKIFFKKIFIKKIFSRVGGDKKIQPNAHPSFRPPKKHTRAKFQKSNIQNLNNQNLNVQFLNNEKKDALT